MQQLAALHPEAAYLLTSVTNNTYPGDSPRPVAPLKLGSFQGMMQRNPAGSRSAFPKEWPPAQSFEVLLEEDRQGYLLTIDVLDHLEIGRVSVQIGQDGQANSVDLEAPGGRLLFSQQRPLQE